MALNFAIDINEELEDGTVNTRTVKATLLREANEITLKRWASYFVELEKQPDWFREFHKARTEKDKLALQENWTSEQWAESYVIFGKLCLLFIEGQTLVELMELPLSGEAEGVQNLFGLFMSVIDTVYGYEPKEREFFEWKGRRFKAFVPVSLAGQKMPGANMSVRDAVNALQLEHAWNQHTGANDYNINVGVLAALSREVVKGKVEVPPVDGPGLLIWQHERQQLFEDITMDIALDVVFFSIHLKALSRHIPLSLSCLLRPVTAV